MWYKGFNEKQILSSDTHVWQMWKTQATTIYFCPITLLYAVHDHIPQCFIQSYKFAYGFGEVCVSGHLIYFPFFAGIMTDWFSALHLHNLPYYRSDHTYVHCVQWKQSVYSNIFPSAVCFYFSSNWKTVCSHQTKNNWKTKSTSHQTW